MSSAQLEPRSGTEASTRTAFLVVDSESIPDGRLLNIVKYGGQGLSDEHGQRHLQRLAEPPFVRQPLAHDVECPEAELPELLAVSDRILILRDGQVDRVLDRSEIHKEEDLHHAIQRVEVH